MSLSPENAALIDRLEARMEISTSTADGLRVCYGQANALLDAARSEAAKGRDADIDTLANKLAESQSALQSAEARLAEAVKVLEPFGEAARALDEEVPGLPDHTWLYATDDSLTLGECRAARAFLISKPTGG